MRPFAVAVSILVVASVLAAGVFFAYFVPFSSAQAITLHASLNATSVSQNQVVRVTLSDKNLLWDLNRLPQADDWGVANVTTGHCGNLLPLGISLYQGRYTEANLSLADSLQVQGLGYMSCILISGDQYFGPMQTKTAHFDLVGFYAKGSLRPFPPGTYTVYAGDEWGHFRLLYFTVVP